ncbi:MAG TPA: peptidoglycan-binding domain-containing protein [Bryobacteraceae bacterium]|nr:peptidoglycan-binding domain-containing protein [Bryobacteraceae bacterium]
MKTRPPASRRMVRGRRVGGARSAAPPKPLYQQRPDSDRYQEIQKALQDRGYFKGEANGDWNDDSTEALKHFQVDQSLTNDGKISARTLAGLGLGPKHDGASVAPPPASSLPPATPPPAILVDTPPASKPQ